MPSSVTVQLSISADEYLKLYKGTAKTVVAPAVDGRNIRFPARILKPFVTKQGVSGRFIIYFDEQGKFKWIEQSALPDR